MKTIITTIALTSVIIFSEPGCKKNDSQQLQTTMQKIQGTWLLQSVVDNSHYSGTDHITTTSGTSSDYFDFRSDGKIYFSIFGSKDTSTYSLSGDTKIVIDGTETYDIKTLTSNSFIIYQKNIVSSSDYDEETIYWKK